MISETIIIRADGSVEPGDAPIKRSRNTYILTNDIQVAGDGIIIGKDDITINGDNHTLKGIGRHCGIDVSKRKNVTISNIWIQNFDTGIRLNSAVKNRIVENIVENSMIGLFLNYSSNNEIAGNEFVNCGLIVTSSYNNIIEDNHVNGKSLIYLESETNSRINGINAGQVILVRCENILVENLYLSNATTGVELWETSNARIKGNRIENNNLYGIALVNSSNNEIIENVVKNNGCGIFLSESSNNNKIFHNAFIKNMVQASIYESGENVWDDGLKGNYWSDYHEIARALNTPYIIDRNNMDKYPLIKNLEEEIKKLEEYLWKLEQLKSEGKVSEKIYKTLKEKYECEMEKLVEELE